MLKPPDFPNPVPNDIFAAPNAQNASQTEGVEICCGERVGET